MFKTFLLLSPTQSIRWSYQKLFFNQLRSNCMSSVPPPQSERYCLLDMDESHIHLDEINKIIEDSGFNVNDKTVKSCIDTLKSNSVDSRIDSCSFLNLVNKPEFSLLSKIVQRDIVIPDWQSFTKHVKAIFEQCRKNTNGDVASYIPQLSKFDPDLWGVSICTVDGQRFSVGDAHVQFCMQSTSKPLNYALALTELGSGRVHEFVGYEPSGTTFNAIQLNHENKPHNPMINSGAIIISSLLKQNLDRPARFEYIIKQYRRLCGYETMSFNNSVFMSEKATADRNYALAYLMREYNCFPDQCNMQHVLDLYFQLCSLEVDCASMSVIGATLANGGACPTTNEKILSPEAVRDTLSLMHSCGMYDYSGQFAFKCGLPCKSGVSGSCLLVIPNVMGIGIWSPPLDRQGNSCRALQFVVELVERFNFHHFDSLLSHHNKIDPRKFPIPPPPTY